MADRTVPLARQAVMDAMGLTPQEIERRKRVAGISQADVGHIATIKNLIVQHVEDFTRTFFDSLSVLEEAKGLFHDRDLQSRARLLKRDHLAAMVEGNLDVPYVEHRLELALLYSSAGLEQHIFLGAFHSLLRHIGGVVMKRFENSPQDGFDHFMALNRIAFFDLGIITDVLAFERERVIRQQREAIRELSTPVLKIRERLLLLPLVGMIDTQRARLLTDSLLASIRANRAKVVVMDVTGMTIIDSGIIAHLLQSMDAARLMGAQVIVTGLSAQLSQSLVLLGIDLATINAVGDLQAGIDAAERLLDRSIEA
jgi:rsbT co-antagonist protein RsbR